MVAGATISVAATRQRPPRRRTTTTFERPCDVLLPLRTAIAAALAAAGGLALAACTASSSGAADGSSGVIHVDWATGNTTLDPASACAADDASLIHNLYATLTTYGTTSGPDDTSQYDPADIVPSFAKSWDISADGKTYTFHLHTGAKFADGTPMDSAAVKYSIERVVKTGACGAFYLQAGLMAPPLISSIETPDAATVIFKLSRPNVDFLAGLATHAGSIVDPKAVEAHGGVKAGAPNEWMAGHVAGAGPYILSAYDPNNRAVLKANPNYFGAKPANKEIDISYVTAPSTLLLNAKSGAADVTLGLPLQSAKNLASASCCRVIANDAPQFAQVALSNATAPLNNVKLREALTLATPYQDILNKIAYGYGRLFYGPVVPNVAGYDAAGSAPVTYNLTAAKQALAASGLPTPVSFTMIVNGAAPAAVQLATALQGAWKDIGVNAQVKQLAPSDFTPTYTAGKFQAAVTIEGPGVPTASYQLTLTSSCGSMFNNAKVCIPGLDAQLDKARAEGPSKAASTYAAITALWRKYWPRIPLYSAQGVTVLSKSVTHYYYSKFVDFSTWTVGK